MSRQFLRLLTATVLALVLSTAILNVEAQSGSRLTLVRRQSQSNPTYPATPSPASATGSGSYPAMANSPGSGVYQAPHSYQISAASGNLGSSQPNPSLTSNTGSMLPTAGKSLSSMATGTGSNPDPSGMNPPALSGAGGYPTGSTPSSASGAQVSAAGGSSTAPQSTPSQTRNQRRSLNPRSSADTARQQSVLVLEN
ncbi:hypothetical protein O181_064532 [Austropuccinia psidii MF-1]|uniref:Uncharacterized protein n=1 Tax=Austropuccinia psidii MF-1 TaxID=1389203 RepID=A0A9Q3I2E9_9BASI|nr:hypothetical protein [Austropuccinia psidii MF-1]